MDTSTQLPNPPSASQVMNKPNRTSTTPPDFEGMETSSRSNGRSSPDSTLDRPRTQGGEIPDNAKAAGGRRFSKLLRKRKKKNNQNRTDETATGDNDRDIGNRSNESPDGHSPASSSNGNSNPPENDNSNLLTDDSEPDRYASNATTQPM